MPFCTARRALALGALLVASACNLRPTAGDGEGLEVRWSRAYAAPVLNDLTGQVQLSAHRSGGVLAWGHLQAPRTLGGVTLTPQGSVGSSWVLHLGPDGAQRWAWSADGVQAPRVVRAESDAEAHTWALITEGTGLTVAGTDEVLIAKQARLVRLDPSGAPVGAWSFGLPDADTVGSGLVVDLSGQRVTVSLVTNAALDLGAAGVLPPVGPVDTVLLELGLDGAVRSARRIGGKDAVKIRVMAHTQAGRLLAVSARDATLALGPDGTGRVEVGGAYVLVREAPDGQVHRVAALPAAYVEGFSLQLNGLGMDDAGNGYLLANALGPMDLGFGRVRNTGVLVKYGADGTLAWGRQLGHALAHGLAVTPDGRTLVSGEFVADITLAGATLYNAGGVDLFVAAFDQRGERVAHRSFGSPDSGEIGWSVAWSGDGPVFLGGQAPGRLSLGDAQLDPPRGQLNTFLVALDAP